MEMKDRPERGDYLFSFNPDTEEFTRDRVEDVVWGVTSQSEPDVMREVRWSEELDGWIEEGLDPEDFEDIVWPT